MNVKKIFKRLVFSVGLKINIILAGIMVFYFISTVINQYYFDSYSNSYDNQLSYFYSIQEMKECFSKSRRSLSNYLKTGNRSQLSEYNDSITLTNKIILELSDRSQDDESYFLLQSMRKVHNIYFSEGCRASFFYNMGNYDYYGRLYYSEKIQAYLQSYADELLKLSLTNTSEKTETIIRNIKVLKIYTMFFIFIIIAVDILFHWYVSSALTKPLSLLVKQAQGVSSGNFDIQVPVKNPKNSVGVLITAFNNMVSDVKKNVEYQKLLSQATFLALQAQTNPHFLFNTLNSISRTISLNKKEIALQMIESLSLLLRYSLSESGTPVSFQEELEITEEYIKIQKLRFGGRITYKSNVSKEIAYNLLLPKLTLQPLVENAIIHGLEPKEKGGKIVISVSKRKGYALLRIFDNGIGMSKEKLNEALNANPVSSKRIGLANTKKRLEIFAEQKGGNRVFDIFTRKTEKESWTMIQIRLKIMQEEK
ncbi:histidine kinase [Treponema parvum]|uniref:Histidine kinase n=1 Tax=Treponema parvum TaxID=138851 RepID=A0A975IFE3_9SPIR|nr:histidine kinase [Treponema parvum]QTQ15030.1 histidine kinase [Treponema parvum]